MDNARLLLAGIDAWNHDDRDAWLSLLAPDVEVQTAGVFPDLELTYTGHEGAAEFWRRLHEPWEIFRIDVEDVEAEADIALASVRFRATGMDSGVQVDMRFCNAIRVRGGLATALVNRLRPEDARAALM